MDATDRHNGKTHKRTCLFVRLFVSYMEFDTFASDNIDVN